ncbi:hypothetical protein [Lysinibacillus fusiformis]|uniref:hypothetical protein n=1 Tax=Lysinibacillus fusiformis TaxID=28031 RepID=UPI0011A7A0B1|nr:hypothetical protein [Lysinibacillus fusiformis]
MVRKKLNSTKKENIYWYYDSNKKKKYAYRYKFYDHTLVRREKTKQNFNTSIEAEKALTALKTTVLNGGEKIIFNENMTIAQWVDIYFDRKKSKWKGISPKTYRNVIEIYIKPYIGR